MKCGLGISAAACLLSVSLTSWYASGFLTTGITNRIHAAVVAFVMPLSMLHPCQVVVNSWLERPACAGLQARSWWILMMRMELPAWTPMRRQHRHQLWHGRCAQGDWSIMHRELQFPIHQS